MTLPSVLSLAILAETTAADSSCCASPPLMPWCDVVSALLSPQLYRRIICPSGSHDIEILDPLTLTSIQRTVHRDGVQPISFATMPFCREYLKTVLSPAMFGSLTSEQRLLLGAGMRGVVHIFTMQSEEVVREENCGVADLAVPESLGEGASNEVDPINMQLLFELSTPLKWPAQTACVDSRPLSIFSACFHTNCVYRLDLAVDASSAKKQAKADTCWTVPVKNASGVAVIEHANLVVGGAYNEPHVLLIHIDTGTLMGRFATVMNPGGLSLIPPNAERLLFPSDCREANQAEITLNTSSVPEECCISFAYFVSEGGFVPVLWHLVYDNESKEYTKKREIERSEFAEGAGHIGNASGVITGVILDPARVSRRYFAAALRETEEEEGKAPTTTEMMIPFLVRSTEAFHHRYTCDVKREKLVLEAKRPSRSYAATMQ